MTTSAEKRGGGRLPVALPVRARLGRTTRNLTTLDVSRDGAYVVVDKPPARGQLVHIKVILPDGGEQLPLRGMVLHVVSGEEARERSLPAGMGIQFYGLGRRSSERWREFFDRAYTTFLASGGIAHPPTPASPARRAGAPHLEPDSESTLQWPPRDAAHRGGEPGDDSDVPTGRRLGRPSSRPLQASARALVPTGRLEAPLGSLAPAFFRVCPPDAAAVGRFRGVALESGGVVLLGAPSRRPGEPAVVALVHPVTGAEFHVPGEVQPTHGQEGRVAVRFLGVTEWTKREFDRFARSGETPAVGQGPAEPEMSSFESAEEAQWDLVLDHGDTIVVTDTLPLEAAVNPFFRRPQSGGA